MVEFEPVIVGFVCNECVYAAADLAGTTRLSYPPNIRLIRVPCSGQVDIIHILRAFENGADGVFVGGCLPDQCHYTDGNVKAENRIEFLKNILIALGLEEERLSVKFLSAAMGSEFANYANELTNTIKKLGPSPLRNRDHSPLSHDNKRVIMRNMLLSIFHALSGSKVEYKDTFTGFGETELDETKCIGCGACSYVCKDKAITTEVKNDIVIFNNMYWKCTACGRCQEVCPKDCIKVSEKFDLIRFLEGDMELKVEVGMLACQRCQKPFVPLMMAVDVEKMLTGGGKDTDFLGLCPSCRKFHQAEKQKEIHGFSDRIKGIETFRKIPRQTGKT
jgi:coenzyme F420-reducing hydrogenase delta subunit/ferredoxin